MKTYIGILPAIRSSGVIPLKVALLEVKGVFLHVSDFSVGPNS
jgi:hypothetical protein